jgi:tRNA threonylcarbamoyl adenosine modification protein (Sua5/YciO/YrdC/YwlC family)
MTAAPEIEEAVDRIGRGELVAYPTETLFGLGAEAATPAAVERLRAWKGRGEDQPLSLLISGVEALPALGVRLPAAARRLAGALWPGPVTLVLRCERAWPPGVTRRSDGALGVRCASHPVAAALARRLAERGIGPITATSLNRSGDAPAATLEDAARLCAGPGGPWLLEMPGAPDPSGAPSTVVDATGETPRVLREGAISRARIAALLGAGEGA